MSGMHKNYEMIVLDLDGTLTDREKKITPRTREALMEAQRRGKKVVLASGRPTPGVLPLAKELALAEYGGFILSFNGGMIMNCATGEVVFSRLLPVEANRRIIELAEDQRVDYLTYEGSRLIVNDRECPYAQKESRISHMPMQEEQDMAAYLDFPVPKFLFLDDGDYLALVEPRVKAALGKNFSVYHELLQKNPDDALLFALCQGIGAAFQCDLPGLLLGQSFGRRVKLPQDVLAGAVIIRRHMHPPYTRVV